MVFSTTAITILAMLAAGAYGDWMNRQYNTSEAEKTRNFNSQEAEKSRDFSLQEADTTRMFNSAEAQKNRDWQKMMSDTSYQRAVRDMQSAGLNPILAANSGAAVGSGSSASSTPAVSTFGGSSAQASYNQNKTLDSILGAAGVSSAQQELEFKMRSIPPKRSGSTQNIYRNGKLVRSVDTHFRY